MEQSHNSALNAEHIAAQPYSSPTDALFEEKPTAVKRAPNRCGTDSSALNKTENKPDISIVLLK